MLCALESGTLLGAIVMFGFAVSFFAEAVATHTGYAPANYLLSGGQHGSRSTWAASAPKEQTVGDETPTPLFILNLGFLSVSS